MVDNSNGRSRSRATAVVVGASMAGLCAARVLAEHFGEVLVLERDRLPEDARARRRVPQGRHPHLLWITGARLLEFAAFLLLGVLAFIYLLSRPQR